MSQPVPISASGWNHFFDLAAAIALIALAIVIGAMIFFMVRYREQKGQPKFIPDFGFKKGRARENMIFATISIIILVSLVVASYQLTPNARFEPAGASKGLVIDVTAFQWAFRFGYPDGVNTLDQLNLPGNTTVMFNVTSTDVMHNLYLVQFRVSIEAIPGRYNVIWVTTPIATGNQEWTYNIECKELCGIGHTFMDATMTVMSQTAYNQWLASQMPTNATTTGG
ncbi:MAG: cytochrome c oxidase subunit II [Candidatus Bathyarchaeia archaeon]